MRTYRVVVSKDWSERGEVVVEADSKEEARDLVRDMLSEDSDEIEWGNMDPDGRQEIESVEEE